ncbi:SIS domain-containing protein [Sagittula salina]|uniref:SIS domain-containing protein n=1 Tax=Sagittula salina TaxID=2820268 RepID=A0A940MSG2_9RHOB|nr:SIS domain-containing protein [Sagittula salina]MBP0482159.1 SIS domain-containing protein [Sagittula salina]
MTEIQPSHMKREVREIPDAVARLLENGADGMARAADALRTLDPPFLATVARGSSDHAATYVKYAAEIMAGLPVASVGPSVTSIYGARLRVKGAACLAISQSGASPDIVQMVTMMREEGALTLGLTNHLDSRLAQVSDHALALHAGPELSVAATKTFVTSAVAGVWLVAELLRDAPLLAALHALPDALAQAVDADWSPLGDALGEAESLYCLGRGPCYAASNEAALKFKETCQLHAESYSSAEVLHGPVSIVGRGFPVIALAVRDAAQKGLVEVAEKLAGMGAQVFTTSSAAQDAVALPAVRTGHPLTDPLALIVSFYAMVEQVARARGVDPDNPRHLRKVTETV